MEHSTIYSKFQIMIPKSIREKLKLTPGQKVIFIPYRTPPSLRSGAGSIRMVIGPGAIEAFGSLKGIDTTIERDEEADNARE